MVQRAIAWGWTRMVVVEVGLDREDFEGGAQWTHW